MPNWWMPSISIIINWASESVKFPGKLTSSAQFVTCFPFPSSGWSARVGRWLTQQTHSSTHLCVKWCTVCFQSTSYANKQLLWSNKQTKGMTTEAKTSKQVQIQRKWNKFNVQRVAMVWCHTGDTVRITGRWSKNTAAITAYHHRCCQREQYRGLGDRNFMIMA